jgi:hypothetical protein
MSRKININEISVETREQLSKELQIRIDGSTFVSNSQPIYIYPIDEVDEYLYIPFAYGRICTGGPFSRPERISYPTIKCNFSGSLRDEQKIVKTEAIDNLNKYGSIIIAAFPGFGKSCTALYIATKIKLRTLIVTHQILSECFCTGINSEFSYERL